MDKKSYENASFAAKENEVKKVKTVTTGKVRLHEKNTGDRIKDLMCNESARKVGDYLVYDILLPALKKTISQMVSNGTDMLLFGEVKSSSRNRFEDDGYTSYHSYYSSKKDKEYERDRKYNPRSMRASFKDFRDPEFDNIGDAKRVISELYDLMHRHGNVSIGEFYDIAGIKEFPHTYYNYGWTSFPDLTTRRVIDREGYPFYIIEMPRPESLD